MTSDASTVHRICTERSRLFKPMARGGMSCVEFDRGFNSRRLHFLILAKTPVTSGGFFVSETGSRCLVETSRDWT